MSSQKRNPLNTVGRLAFAGGAALVVLFFLASSKSLLDIKQWQRDAVPATGALLRDVSTTELAQQKALEAVRHFAETPTDAARNDVINELDVLSQQLERLTSEETEASLRLTGQPVPGSFETNLDSELMPLHLAVADASTPTVQSLERTILNLQMGDAVDAGPIANEVEGLARVLNPFKAEVLEHNLQVNDSILKSNELLTARVIALVSAILVGLLLACVPVTRYVRQKSRALQDLHLSNDRLAGRVEEAEHLAAILSHSARHDGLTNLMNRTGFNDVLEGILEEGSGRHGLCFIDLDLFKIVNDTSGHAAGDHLLKRVASVLKSHLPKRGHAIRLGGDEFLIFAPFTTDTKFKELVQACVDELNPLRIEYDGQHFDVTASFGATYFDASEHTSDTVMSVVDAACYEAKNAGGGRVHFHSGKEGAVESRRTEMMWVAKIRDSLENKRMQLHFQNIVDASVNKPDVHSKEILVRMLDDDGKILSPGTFLDIAERFSLAPKIDKFVIDETFKWLRGTNSNVSQESLVNINLSGRSIGDTEVLRFIEDICGKYNTPSNKVCLEITETAAVGKNARDFLIQLHRMGFKLALDDFGSGFSSFGYLESLPVDYIKIDGLFVRDLDSNKAHREFVMAINRVGKAMGKLTVAEFVENEKQLQLLEEMGVDFAQGFHIHKPAELATLATRSLISGFADFQNAA